MSGTTGRHRALIVFMGLVFAGILCSSLWQRFLHPDLELSRLPAQPHSESAMGENMELVGQLMQKAAKNPQDLETNLKLVETLMAMGQWDGAENFAQKALELSSANPAEIRPLYYLSLIHHNRGQHEQAAELLEKLLEKNDDPSARYNLGILYAHYLNQPEKGMAQFQAGLEKDGLSPALKAALGEELDKIKKGLPQKAPDAAPAPASP